MPLSLTIGSGPIALVQAGTVVRTNQIPPGSVGQIGGTLPLPSTAGTALVALIGSDRPSTHPGTFTFPPGWQLLVAEDSLVLLEAWIYLNNPGGINTIAIQATPEATFTLNYEVTISEWANVRAAAALDTSGVAASAAGTTLAPTTIGNVAVAGEVGISAWRQAATVVGAATFTTPGGWTRLADNGADATTNNHLDAEYQLNPASGAPLGPTLTSSRTTAAASGVIVVLMAAHPAVDMTAYLAY